MAMIHLPDEILMDILSRLPVKPLLRFRSVSKSWRSLISCTDFAELQFKRACSVREIGFYKIMVFDWSDTIQSIDCDVSSSFAGPYDSRCIKLPFSGRARVLGTVNGLICVCSFEYDNFYIYNPCTMQFKEIPTLKNRQHMRVSKYGFGYDSTTNVYKLLIVSLHEWSWFRADGDAMISLFSLKRGSWRSFIDTKYLNNYCYGCSGTFLNNAIHWRSTDVLPNVNVIVSFELAEESFSIIPLPDRCQKFGHPIVLDGCLSLYTYKRRNHYTHEYTLAIWVMKEYGVSSSWTELIAMDFPEDSDYSNIYPLCLTPEGEIVFKYVDQDLASFDTQTKSFNVHHKSYHFRFFYPIVHVETLISPHASKQKYKHGQHEKHEKGSV